MYNKYTKGGTRPKRHKINLAKYKVHNSIFKEFEG